MTSAAFLFFTSFIFNPFNVGGVPIYSPPTNTRHNLSPLLKKNAANTQSGSPMDNRQRCASSKLRTSPSNVLQQPELPEIRSILDGHSYGSDEDKK